MKRPRVALVEAAVPSTHVYSRTYLPRVGIATIAAVLKSRGYECDLWFQAMPGMDEAKLHHYDIVGISSLTGTVPEAYKLADSLKQDGVVVVMGGPHITFMREEALEHCDYVVVGEGDVTFLRLVEALEREESTDAVAGLAYRSPDGEVHDTGPPDAVDFENLPSPDFLLSPQVEPERIPPIVVTSRGCPHNCAFCSVTALFGRRYRFKRNEQVIAELRPILSRSVCFGDDNFCAHPPRTKSLLRDMIAHNAVPFTWSGEMCVAAGADDELLGLLQETRCRIMYVGVESVSPDTLKSYGKSHDLKAVERCIENLHHHNIGIHGMFVVDVDDDVEAAQRITDYAIATGMDTIQILSLTPFPGTASHEKYKDKLLHRLWQYYDGMHVVAEPLKASAHDMQMAIMRAMQRFYSVKRVLTAYRRGRGWRMKYRMSGYLLVRKWLRENAEYLERLRTNDWPSAT